MPVKYDENGAVKRPNKEMALTREMVEDFARCAQDVVYFAENYYWIINPVTGEQRIELYDFQKKILRNLQQNRFNILLAARQVGKALDLDTPILTPNGFTTMGEIEVGDTIYGKDGKETRVTFITEVMEDKDVYEIEFDNGEVIKACSEHLWEVVKDSEKCVITTLQLLEIYENIYIESCSKNFDYDSLYNDNIKEYVKNVLNCQADNIKIKSIKKIESVPVRCLQVDNEDHLFLCGKTLIPTHNTTCSAIFLLWYALFHKAKTVAILANKADNAKAILAEIKFAYERLPEFLKAGAAEYNAFNVRFDNNSEIICRATSPDALRSLSVSLLMLDEFAFVQPNIADAFWASNYPTISCLPKDTIILTENGFEEIGDYIPDGSQKGDYIEINDLSVYGKNGIEKASHFYVSPKSETKIIRTRYGLKHESTLDHPILTLDKSGVDMKKSQDIKIGDYVRVDYGMEIYGNHDELNYYDKGNYSNGKSYDIKIDNLTKEIGYLIGGYIAAGCASQNKIYISNSEDEFRNSFINSDLFDFKPTKSDTQKLGSSQDTYRFFNCVLGDVSDKKCYEKIVPKSILKASKDVQEGFISGYIDGDGSILPNGDTVLTSTSEKLLLQIQMMLLNMGIISNIHKLRVEKTKLIGNYVLPQGANLKSLKDSYHLVISRCFADKLSTFGLKITRKRERLENTSVCEKDKNKQFKIPLNDLIFGELCRCFDASGKTKKYFRDNGVRLDKVLKKSVKNINVVWLKRFVNVCKCYSELFNEILTTPCFFDEVVSIEDSENDTFDLTCPETHTFLQNGIMGSNTGGSIVVVSTPQGTANLYYRLWKDAIDGNNSFVPLKVNWREVPGRDESWYEETIKNIGKIQFAQEYECIFRRETINIRCNDKTYEVEIGDLYEQGKDFLQTLQPSDESNN